MKTIDCRYGYRIVGNLFGRRRLVVAGDAFAGCCACDGGSRVGEEAYLSAFCFPLAIWKWMKANNGSTAGYAGVCGSPRLQFDLDYPDDLDEALRATRRLVGGTLERYRALDEDDLLIFFSGSKGFHVGLPLPWGPTPSETFHAAAKRMAEGLAGLAGVQIDTGVYDRVRAFRAPNSRHPKTGLHKRRLSRGELDHLTADRIRDLARSPLPFDPPGPSAIDPVAVADWAEAEADAGRQAEGKALRRADAPAGVPTLNRSTAGFIREGAAEGDRHRLLFSAAANLAEFGCPPALAHALLTEPGLDSGLKPSDVRRQIDCGLSHAADTPTADTPHQECPP